MGESTSDQLPRKLGNETNSGSRNLTRTSQRSGVEIKRVRSSKESPTRFRRFKILYPDRFILKLFAAGMLLDPLFLYIPVVSEQGKCTRLDKNFGITICVLHTIFDIANIIFYIIFELRNDLHKDAGIRVLLINTFSVLPLSQVMVIPFLIRSEILSMFTSNVLLFLSIPIVLRLIRLLKLLKKVLITSSPNFARWVVMFFFFYVFFSQYYGAYWYLLAIKRENDCWRKACRIDNGCFLDTYNCNKTLETHKFSNDFCSRNTTKYDFGIVRDAYQSGILEMTGADSGKKILYCLRWALQNLGGFGQNLPTDLDVWGNFFVISVVYTSVVLFFFLVGEMQVYLQSDAERSQKKYKKLQETEKWAPFKKLSENLQSQMKKYQQKDVLPETKGLNIEDMLYNLPKDLRGKINQKLCLEQLKKMEYFKWWSEASLEDLCDCLKPVFFVERTRIIREGDPIDEMILVVQGKLWTYTSSCRAITTGSPSIGHRNRKNEQLGEGDFCGEELISWLQADPYTSELPVSTRTIQAVTDVEAFLLMAYDLKNLFIKQQQAVHFLQLYWRFRRVLRTRRNTQSPT